MAAYALPEISQLHHQLKLSPSRLRLKQIRGVEHALSVIDRAVNYPYDLVCYWITGFRQVRTGSEVSLPGEGLIPDLVRLAEDLSRTCAIPATALTGPYYTQEELAKRFSVSTKTISRWRQRGLGGFRVTFPDGQVKLVIEEKAVRRLVVGHADLIRKAAAFTQLTPEEKEQIIGRARELLLTERLRLHELSQRVAVETGRAVETVRYTLRRHDKENAEQAIFEPDGSPRVPPEHRRIYAAYQDGRSVEEIARMAGSCSEAVARVILEMRAREIHQRPITFVANKSFEDTGADREILGQPCPANQASAVSGSKHPKGVDPYIQGLYEIPLLSQADERVLFRRYNYVKFKASRLRLGLDSCYVNAELLDEIEGLLRHADEIKNHLIKCNLRLVVNIAKRHVGSSDRFFEVVSDGNLALMRAVENFDYARGNKFSTYATWAVMKTFARTIPESHYRMRRFVTGQEEVLQVAMDTSESTGPLSRFQAIKEVLAVGWKGLTSREQNVLQRHFGLQNSGKAQTLEQIGRAFGISKERVRQIEIQALAKLQVALAPMQADVLA